MQLAVRDRLAYPAGYAPGFDPSHPAATACAYSSIAGPGAGPINLLTPSNRGTVGNAAQYSAVIDGIMGPCIANNGVSLSPGVYNPTGFPTGTPAGCTWGFIFSTSVASPSGNVYLFESSNVTNGQSMFQQGPGLRMFTNTGISTSSFITANTPYFVAASLVSGVSMTWVIVNLLNGKTTTQVQTTSVPVTVAEGPTYVTWGRSNGANGAVMTMAAMMYAPAATSLAGLLAWAKDPWAFWYPSAAVDTPHVFSTFGGSLFHAFTQLVSVTATSTVVLGSKTIGKLVNVVSTSATSFLKSVAKSVLVSSVTTTTISALKAFIVAFTAGCTTAVFTARGVGKLVAVTSTSATSFLKAVAKKLLVTSTSATTVTARKLLHFTQSIVATCTTSTVWTTVKNTFVSITKAMKLKSYTPNNYPTIDGAAHLYILAELKKISAMMGQHIEATKDLDKRLTAGGL